MVECLSQPGTLALAVVMSRSFEVPGEVSTSALVSSACGDLAEKAHCDLACWHAATLLHFLIFMVSLSINSWLSRVSIPVVVQAVHLPR